MDHNIIQPPKSQPQHNGEDFDQRCCRKYMDNNTSLQYTGDETEQEGPKKRGPRQKETHWTKLKYKADEGGKNAASAGTTDTLPDVIDN